MIGLLKKSKAYTGGLYHGSVIACLFTELSEIDGPTSHDQHMACMIYDTKLSVGHSGELLNDNNAF